MANVVFFIVLAAGLVWLVLWARKQAARPSRRLRRTFRRYRRNVVASVSRAAKAETHRLLTNAEEYLEGLLRAKEQLVLLRELEQAGQELLGAEGQAPSSPQPLERRLQERLEEFFGQLSKVAAASAFQDDATLEALRLFGEDLEVQQEALRELALELSVGLGPSPADAPTVVGSEQREPDEINA